MTVISATLKDSSLYTSASVYIHHLSGPSNVSISVLIIRIRRVVAVNRPGSQIEFGYSVAMPLLHAA